MIEFLLKKLNISPQENRTSCGIFCGLVGVVINILLAAIKGFVGLLSGSVAVLADAINNLSDAGSSVVTMVGFKLSSLPDDDEHPFGHGRFEYISGLIVAIIILAVGLDFFKHSCVRLWNPLPIKLDNLDIWLLCIAFPFKLILFFFYKKMGKIMDSETVKAAAFDSLSDMITSSVVLLTAIFSKYLSPRVDASIGVVLACFILVGGYKVLKSIINPLLGECADSNMVEELRARLLACNEIRDVHDIVIHSYGANRYFATAHAEIEPNSDSVYIHDTMEAAEVEIAKHMPIKLLLHCDPFSSTDKTVKRFRAQVEDVIAKLDHDLRVYDFRLNDETKQMEFSMLVHRKYQHKTDKLKEEILIALKELFPEFTVKITVEFSFCSQQELKK
jgi:cation diffusion facilitator family transporter